MLRTALLLALALVPAFSPPALSATPETEENLIRNTISVHPIGTAVNFVPHYELFQFTYERHSSPGRYSQVWDPLILLNNEDDGYNKDNFQIFLIPLYAPRWYFRPRADGWFAGIKAGYMHWGFTSDVTNMGIVDHRHAEMGYAAGEIGFKKAWGTWSFYVSAVSGGALGFRELESKDPLDAPAGEKTSGVWGTPLGHFNAALGYGF